MGVSARGRDSSFSQNQDWSASAACWLSVTLSYIASDRLPYIPRVPPFSHSPVSVIGPLRVMRPHRPAYARVSVTRKTAR